MLAGLEQFLSAAVDAVLPNTVTVVAGPRKSNAGAGVFIHARKLALEPLGDDPPEDAPGHLLTTHDWPADGSTLDFTLPPDVVGELLEVEAPPGYPAARGDQFFLADRTLRFYRPPALANPGVRARLKGDAAKGYRRRRACRISLVIAAYDQDTADVDDQLQTALHVSLAELIELPLLDAGEVAGVQVWMRVHRLKSALESIEREAVEGTDLVAAIARLELRGELDLLVARGAPEPVGVIEELRGVVQVEGYGQSFTVQAAGSPTPTPTARAIESQPSTVIIGLGPTTNDELLALDPPITTLAELAVLDVDAIADELGSSATTIRANVQRAKLILAALPRLPSLPPSAEAETLDALLALTITELAALLERGIAYAKQLRDELLTLQLLLKSSAMASLTLADFR